MAQAGTATVKFVGDYSRLNAGLASVLAPSRMRGAGLKAGLALGGAFAGAMAVTAVVDQIGKAIKVTKEFDKQMSSLGAVANASAKEMVKLREQSIKMGAATVYSATEAAQAQIELAKGGLNASQILGGALKSSLSLAAAGELDLADAAETTVNAMKLFELQGRATGKIADMLATAANTTTADVEDFAMALRQGGAVAKQAGYDLNDTVTILEALAEAGVKNSDAGTSMKAALIQLINPTKKQAAEAKRLGISWLNQSGELKNAVGISKELRAETKDMTKAERTKTFAILAGTDGFRTLSSLYDSGAQKLRRFTKANEESGTAAEIAAKKTDNLAGDTEQLSGAWETFQIRVGTALSPMLRDATQAATGLVNSLNAIDLDTEALGTGSSWGKVLGDASEFGKAFAQIPFDADGGIKRIIETVKGDDEEVSQIQQITRLRLASVASLKDAVSRTGNARRRASRATEAERHAEKNLADARKRFGSGSDEVVRAEIRLHRAKQKTIRLTERAKRAERLEGIERQIAAKRSRDQVLDEKSRISQLNRTIKVLTRKRDVEWKSHGDTEKLRDIEESLTKKLKARSGSQKRLNDVLSSAASQIGPKFARSLQGISNKTAGILKLLPRLKSPIETVGRTSKTQFGKASDSVADFSETVGDKRKTVNSNMRAMPPVQVEATGKMIQDFSSKITAIQDGGTPQSRRRGGLIEAVRQRFRGGGVPVAVSSGEMFKMPDGRTGVVPGRPTAADNVLTSMPVGTKVFTFDGQRRLAEGASESSALRNQLPHFAGGGIVKPEIVGGSPKARELGNTAIAGVHERASEKLKKARQRAAAAAASSGSFNYTGPPADMRKLGDNAWVDTHTLAVGDYLAKKFNTTITDGWRPQDAGYGAANSSHKRGTPDNPGALDFAVASAEFQSWVGQHVAGITENLLNDAYSTGPHNHVAFFRRGGIARAIQRLAAGGWVKTGYTTYDDYGAGAFGNLPKGDAYAELGTATSGGVGTGTGFIAQALGMSGELPSEFPLDVKIGNGPVGRLYKRDRGYGQGDPNYSIDIHETGFDNVGLSGNNKGNAWIRTVDGSGGASAAERSAAQSKSRKKKRDESLAKMLKDAMGASTEPGKRTGLWKFIQSYSKFGSYEKGEKASILDRVRAAASATDPNRSTSILRNLAQFFNNKIEVSGSEDGDEGFANRVADVKKKAGKRADKKRSRLTDRLGRAGLKYDAKGALAENMRVLESFAEFIDIGETNASAESGPGGSDMTDAEARNVIDLYLGEQMNQRKRKGMLTDAIRQVTYKRDQFAGMVELAGSDPLLKWKLPGYRKGLANARGELSSLGSSMTDLVGVTGRGGAMFQTQTRLDELGVTKTFEQLAGDQFGTGISIADVLQIVEAAKYNVFDRVDRMHSGGIVSGPAGSDQPRVLQAGEGVFTSGQMDAMGGPGNITFEVDFKDEKLKGLIDIRVKNHDRARDVRAKTGVKA